jgi:hypothetical protein
MSNKYTKKYLSSSHQGNTNPTYSEISTHPNQNRYHQEYKKKKNQILMRTCSSMVWEKPTYTFGRNVNEFSQFGNQDRDSLEN